MQPNIAVFFYAHYEVVLIAVLVIFTDNKCPRKSSQAKLYKFTQILFKIKSAQISNVILDS